MQMVDITLGFFFSVNKNWFVSAISTLTFLQAPSSSDNIIRNIYDAIPILEYVCESFSIGNLDDYEIDDNVQLVCKYLQAHSSNKLNPEVRKKCK